ncbi:MAG: hypothetical protein CO108_10455 [Deltaproteobacteria bacterium CG_4_9_14_3_um_filter_63_12]|nr:MAG: hypothetical protein COW42_03920 [Deltaproteobacteria bacterium CG17_big_fil_post_rev_8_21_14_2_50_63_7]PJB43172.1 MAG: hypothetical protein CO108_10455 [Deltaproteobacteria bacterium CG_4_9_14_3_um_filter_63_12]
MLVEGHERPFAGLAHLVRRAHDSETLQALEHLEAPHLDDGGVRPHPEDLGLLRARRGRRRVTADEVRRGGGDDGAFVVGLNEEASDVRVLFGAYPTAIRKLLDQGVLGDHTDLRQTGQLCAVLGLKDLQAGLDEEAAHGQQLLECNNNPVSDRARDSLRSARRPRVYLCVPNFAMPKRFTSSSSLRSKL